MECYFEGDSQCRSCQRDTLLNLLAPFASEEFNSLASAGIEVPVRELDEGVDFG